MPILEKTSQVNDLYFYFNTLGKKRVREIQSQQKKENKFRVSINKLKNNKENK